MSDLSHSAEMWRRCAMSEVTTASWSFEEDVRGYVRAGWQGIGVWLNKLAVDGSSYAVLPVDAFDLSVVDCSRAQLDTAGLRVSSVIATGDYTHEDADERRRHVDHTLFSIEVARRLGAESLCICPGPRRALSYERARELTLQSLHDVLPAAEAANVLLAIEPLRPWHTDFVTTLDQAMDLVEALCHPFCGVYFDTYQLAPSDVFTQLARAAGHITAVHVADALPEPRSLEDRLIPGDGRIPIREMLEVIEQTGYRGWYEVEIMSRDLWQSDYDQLLRHCSIALREVLP